MLEEKAIISGIIKNYKIEAIERREDVQIIAELVIRSKNGLYVQIQPRPQKEFRSKI